METLSKTTGRHGPSRRTLLKGLAGLGVGTATFRRALAAQAAQAGAVTPEMIKQAEWIAGLDLTDDERASAARTIARSLRSFAELRKVDVGYDVPPALTFLPAPPRPAGGRPAQPGATGRDAHVGAAGLGRGAGFPAGHRALELDPQPAGQLDGADEALSRPAQAV